MSEVEALIQKAKESLDAARSLLRDGYPDFAASRAYYAMFYVAEALLAIMGQSYRKHSAVITAFGLEYAKQAKLDAKFHQYLIAAQNYRNVGDYGIEAHVSKADAESVCAWAEAFIRVAEPLLSAPEGQS
ncbi:MAG: DNA-binding protein [Candidatus Methylomirabilota bacterium]|nr:HEPN domain-containing protein [Candidatus Methylomirabilis sp.]PWB46380.1 MAG: DNA-binding protein [candidate division NC10 bacterium]